MPLLTDSATTHEFTPCEFTALCAVVKLLQGELSLTLQGQKEPTTLPKPNWHRFTFFTDFYTSNIQGDSLNLVVGSQLKREVRFFYRHNHCLVLMVLVGVVTEGLRKYGVELESEWALKSIEYRMEFFADSPDRDLTPPRCEKFEFEITGYSK